MAIDDDHFDIDSLTSSQYLSLIRRHGVYESPGAKVNNSRTTTQSNIDNSISIKSSCSGSRVSWKHTNPMSTTPDGIAKNSRNNDHPDLNNSSSQPLSPSNLRLICDGHGDVEDDPNSSYEHNRRKNDSFRSGISSVFSSLGRSCRSNKFYLFDDVSSLYFDEYGYDTKPKRERNLNRSDDSISEFFRAPTKQELSRELVRLIESKTTSPEALECLGKLKMWGTVADSDPSTTKHLVEFQAVPSLLYFVRDVVEQKRSLKTAHVRRLRDARDQNRENGTQFRRDQQAFVDASNNYDLSLHQALQVIHHFTCLGDGESATTNNKKKMLKSLVLKKAILAQLVEMGGVDLLFNLLEEHLEHDDDDATGVNDLRHERLTRMATKVDHYRHSVLSSIWLVLMTVGACEHAIQLLKQPTNDEKSPSGHSRARTLVLGIVVGLDHRLRVAESKDPSMRPIMPERSLSSVINDTDGCGNNNNADICHEGNRNHSSSSSWMEDLFVTLCRLVGSMYTDGIELAAETEKENRRPGHGGRPPNLHPHEHDEMRIMVIELCVVKKCLKLLIDEPNTVLAQNPIVTTLAMSFFYACIQFAEHRYKNLKESEHRRKHRRHSNSNSNNNNKKSNNRDDSLVLARRSTEKLVLLSLDYRRLVEFTFRSVQSFPSHGLIQATGNLILESIPQSYKVPWLCRPRFRATSSSVVPNNVCCGPPIHRGSKKGTTYSKNHRCLDLHGADRRLAMTASFVHDIVEPMNVFCPLT